MFKSYSVEQVLAMIGRKNSQSSRREIGSFPVRRVQGAAIDWLEDEGRRKGKGAEGGKNNN